MMEEIKAREASVNILNSNSISKTITITFHIMMEEIKTRRGASIYNNTVNSNLIVFHIILASFHIMMEEIKDREASINNNILNSNSISQFTYFDIISHNCFT